MKNKLNIILLCLILTGFTPREKVFNILSYGAKSDGKTLNTNPIQKAINAAAASGGGIVLIQRGRFVTGVLHLKSGVQLQLDSLAILLGTDQRLEYGKGDASALIVAEGQNHIAITGKGIIDGQAHKLLKNLNTLLKSGIIQDSDWRRYNPWHQMRPEERNRPKLITFIRCNDVLISGITLKNSSDWVQRYQECTNLIIDGIKVQSTAFLNNDGIDIVDCQHAKVVDCDINSDDDGICLKSENKNSLCQDILIENCRVRSSASAIKFGTASFGGFKDITVRDIKIYNTFRSAVALECVDGGTLEDIHISHIAATHTGNALFIRLGQRNISSKVGQLQNIFIQDLIVSIPHNKPDAGYPMEGPPVGYPHNVFPASITGIPGHPVKNIFLRNISVSYEGGAQKSIAFFNSDTLNRVPERIQNYPEFSMFGELPCWALYVRHVQNLEMKQVSFSSQKEDFRPACIFDEVSGLKINQLNILSSTPQPKIILRKVSGSVLDRLQLGAGSKLGEKDIMRVE